MRIRLLALFTLTLISHLLQGQPLSQNYRTVFQNPSFAGSLGKGRLQLVHQGDYNNHAGSYRYSFISIDDFIPKLKGGIGYSIESVDHELGIMNNATYPTRLMKRTNSVYYSPKISVGKFTLAPSIAWNYEYVIVSGEDETIPPQQVSTQRKFQKVSAGILLNNERFFFGAAYIPYINKNFLANEINLRNTALLVGTDLELHNFRIHTGYNFQFNNLKFKPSIFFNTTQITSRNVLSEYDHFIVVNFALSYRDRFLFGAAFTNVPFLNFGYKANDFSINFTSKSLVPISPSLNKFHNHELTLEYFFHKKKTETKQKTSEQEPVIRESKPGKRIKTNNVRFNNYKSKLLIGLNTGITTYKYNLANQDFLTTALFKRVSSTFNRTYDYKHATTLHHKTELYLKKNIGPTTFIRSELGYMALGFENRVQGVNVTNEENPLVNFYSAKEKYIFHYTTVSVLLEREFKIIPEKLYFLIYAGPRLYATIKAETNTIIRSSVLGDETFEDKLADHDFHLENTKQMLSTKPVNIGIKVGIGLKTALTERLSLLTDANLNQNFIGQYSYPSKELNSSINLINNFIAFGLGIEYSIHKNNDRKK